MARIPRLQMIETKSFNRREPRRSVFDSRQVHMLSLDNMCRTNSKIQCSMDSAHFKIKLMKKRMKIYVIEYQGKPLEIVEVNVMKV